LLSEEKENLEELIAGNKEVIEVSGSEAAGYTELGYRVQTKELALTKEQKDSLYDGGASEELWKHFFKDQDEYNRFVELYKSDAASARKILEFNEDFEGINISGNNSYEKYYKTYEELNALADQRKKLEIRRN
jgi:hypothetical protein